MRAGKSKEDTKVSGKRKAVDKGGKVPVKRGKFVKDANKPKRPPSAFFVFMEEFRKAYKEKHPNNKQVSVVSKAGGDKWKSMSEAEKAPYVAKAAKRKADYVKNMAAYNKKQIEGPGANASTEEEGEGSDKSKSDVEDEEEEGGEEDEEEE